MNQRDERIRQEEQVHMRSRLVAIVETQDISFGEGWQAGGFIDAVLNVKNVVMVVDGSIYINNQFVAEYHVAISDTDILNRIEKRDGVTNLILQFIEDGGSLRDQVAKLIRSER